MSQGYSLVEVMIVTAIIGTLAVIAFPSFQAYVDKARVARAIGDIHAMSRAIDAYKTDHNSLPASLPALGDGNPLDPWGNPYQYLNIEANGDKGARKNQFLKPINADYDLYSMGKDGRSNANIKAKPSLDDIIRANNGGFIGVASSY